MKDNIDFLKEYIETLKKYGKTSEETIEIYRKEVEDFLNFIYPDKVMSLKKDIGVRYVENLKKKFSSLSTKRKIASVSGFYKYLIKKSLVNENPFSEVKIFYEKRDTSSKITEGELIRIIDYCKNDYRGKRDKVVIYLLFISGLTINEILKIRTENVLNFKEINILGKKGIEKIELDNFGMEILESYLQEKQKNSSEMENENLFGNLTRQTFRARFIKYSKEAGIDTVISPVEIKKSVVEKTKKNLVKENFFQEMKSEYMRIGIGDE